MTYLKRTVILASVCMIAACAMPTTAVKSGADRPTLAVIGAPAGSQLLVDGIAIGDASVYNGVDKVLTVEEGTHVVVIKQGVNVLYSQKVFSSNGELARVVLASGASQ